MHWPIQILDKDALGLYSANYKFGAILSVLILAFRNAWQPFFLKTASGREFQPLPEPAF